MSYNLDVEAAGQNSERATEALDYITNGSWTLFG